MQAARSVISPVVLGASVWLGGCASVITADPAADQAAKRFEPVPGKVALYVFRNQTFGGALALDVAVDGRTIGTTGPYTYLYHLAAPGKRTITSRSEVESSIDIDPAAGDLVFVRQEVSMGVLSGRAYLRQVDPSFGKASVLESKLVQAASSTASNASAPGAMAGGPESEPTSSAVSGQMSGLDPAPSGTLSGLDPSPTDAPGGTTAGYDPVPRESGTTWGHDPARVVTRRLGNEADVPYIGEHGRDDYRAWLTWAGPKAFAISTNGMWYGAHGVNRTDASVPAEPGARALALCERRAKQACLLYAVDQTIVWGSGGSAGPVAATR